LFAVTSVGNALADAFSTFVAWRILGGVAVGLAPSLSPLYIAEVAPARILGRLVALNQLTIVDRCSRDAAHKLVAGARSAGQRH
jgi:MFS family permease